MSNRSKAKGGPNQTAPISSHKLFPLMVALWFAALLGLGSIILPPALLEGLINITGIGKALPSASPPIGEASRLVMAAALSILGALLGLCVARRVAAEQSSQNLRQREFAVQPEACPTKRLSEPLSLYKDLWPDDTDQGETAETLDLSEFVADEPAGTEATSRQLPKQEPQDAVEASTEDLFAPVDWPASFEQEHPADFDLSIEQRDLSSLDLGELAQRLDLAVRARARAMRDESEEPAPVTAPLNNPVSAAVAVDGGVASYFQSSPETESLAETAGDEISMDELETSAHGQEEQGFRPIPAAMRPVSLHDDLESLDQRPAPPFSLRRTAPVEPDSGKQVFGSPFAYAPEALDPESQDDAEDDAAAAERGNFSSLLDLQNPFKAGHDFVQIESAEPESESVEPAMAFPGQELRRNLSSDSTLHPDAVLPLASSPARGFTRKGKAAAQASPVTENAVETGTPPVSLRAAAPVQPLDPAETERALRVALATLQRISGSA